MTRALLGVALGAALSLCACASGPRADLRALQHRSAYDLACPAYGLRLHHVDHRTKVVFGCGRTLVYVESCETHGLRKDCTWMLDSPTFAAPAWPLPAPPPGPVAAAAPLTPPASPRPPPVGEGRPIRTGLDGSEQSVIPPRRDPGRPVQTDLFDEDDQARILEHRR